MEISYKWLQEYVESGLSPEEVSAMLTDCGLEVETLEHYESIPGGLEKVVIGRKPVHFLAFVTF